MLFRSLIIIIIIIQHHLCRVLPHSLHKTTAVAQLVFPVVVRSPVSRNSPPSFADGVIQRMLDCAEGVQLREDGNGDLAPNCRYEVSVRKVEGGRTYRGR